MSDREQREQIVEMIAGELRRVFPDPAKIMTAENGLSLYQHFAERIDALEKRVAELGDREATPEDVERLASAEFQNLNETSEPACS